MKSVLISIQPKWVEKICHEIGKENGKPIYEKVVEVRKSRSKLETPFKCYIYQTKKFVPVDITDGANKYRPFLRQNQGKVIGEFICDRITDISVVVRNCNENYNEVYHNDECKGSCLTWKELQEYGKGKPLYGWHIRNLKIYDEPKELSEFYSAKWDMPCEHKKSGFNMDFCMAYENGSHFCKELVCDKKRLTRPPQSWCYVESLGE